MRYLKLTAIVLNLALLALGIMIIGGAINLFGNLNNMNNEGILFIFTRFIILTGLFIILIKIKMLVKNINDKIIFADKNIKILITISNILFIMAIATYFIKNDNTSLQILEFGGFAIKFETLLLASIGLIARIIGDVFNESIKIKYKSDELEEESKYTV
ncbi:hypothetical protein K5V21_09945 [Clostridium sardiniense]|uniref:DUF2975 domain-containing protein n=1 Tax=Clostridium sardiniense TaxID=29369 RepID=A0ABS7KY87_CLOSR|nr:hypothetical protein [Clostridium sardiniense]MBY0755776.1 hypothetical protein [Clostridium sardiniense]MDQ0459996.1 hypothetical protein [Clostridium sardiniense]